MKTSPFCQPCPSIPTACPLAICVLSGPVAVNLANAKGTGAAFEGIHLKNDRINAFRIHEVEFLGKACGCKVNCYEVKGNDKSVCFHI